MRRFFVGSINVPGAWFHATGSGLTECVLNEDTGEISQRLTSPEIENAIWMETSPQGLLVASERFLQDGELALFNDSLARIGSVRNTHGGAICHLALSPDQRNVYAVSYLGGMTIHVMNQGVQPAHQIITYEGSGPNAARQDRSHPHQAVVSPDGEFLFVCDLGSDRIWIHPIIGQKLGPAQAIVAPSGSGPRHLAFHPSLCCFYLLGELDGHVHVYEGEGTKWNIVSSHSALPPDFSGAPGGAAIKLHPTGRTLGVSVRGSNSIAVFHIGIHGELSPAENFSTQGKSPRDFVYSPCGRWLLALNQESDTIVPFELDPSNGVPMGHVGAAFPIGCPTCAVF